MDTREFLQALAKIPNLLELARQDQDTHSYLLQKRMRTQYRQEGRPFLYSMPMRHLVRCELCGQQQTAVQHEVEDPARGVKVAFSELDLHRARFHDVPLPTVLVDFLVASQNQGEEEDETSCT
ncbi:MAG: hypothetical protein JXB85_10475 [Anaerolineales bacterium]|nr:hypothetical protein [Anaerolineales bacterium]